MRVKLKGERMEGMEGVEWVEGLGVEGLEEGEGMGRQRAWRAWRQRSDGDGAALGMEAKEGLEVLLCATCR